MRVYLDYSATTPVDPEVLQAMLPYFSEKFGNPGSLHSFGQEAQIAIDNARSNVADFFGCRHTATAPVLSKIRQLAEIGAQNAVQRVRHGGRVVAPLSGFAGCLTQEIIFTGSATEANNLAIFGTVKAAKKAGVKNPHVITSAIEHKSVLEPICRLEKDGEIELTILPVSKNGLIDHEELKKSLKDNTVLVSIIHANNEIGIIQPIPEISEIVREHNEKLKAKSYKLKAVFHTDAAQAANYLNMKVADLGVDMLTLSSQKIYGPKGAGVLYIKKGVLIEPQILGGEQEYGKRAGTENVPNIVGMGAAIAKINEYKSKNGRILELKNYFIDNVLARIKTASLNGGNPRTQRVEPRLVRRGGLAGLRFVRQSPPTGGSWTKREQSSYDGRENCLPNVANILFKDVNSADLLMMLDMEGVAVSAGSACQARGISGPSYVLLAMGLSEKDAKSSIRFSFGRQTSKEDIDYTIEVLIKLVNKLKTKN